jgi:hypothetical protein
MTVNIGNMPMIIPSLYITMTRLILVISVQSVIVGLRSRCVDSRKTARAIKIEMPRLVVQTSLFPLDMV